MPGRARKTLRIGVDTGGTFTDFISFDGARVRVHKVPSTPDAPERAILQGLDEILEGRGLALDITHGSTVATNALLTRRGAKTALVTTAGFEDLIEIGRQNRKELYDLAYRKPPALVPRELRMGVAERLDEKGGELLRLKASDVRALRGKLKEAGVESVAICLLHAYANPAHEEKVADAVRRSGIHVSMSSQVLPEFREYERMSTTCVNAYVSPMMNRYLKDLESRLDSGRLRVMQSNGGVISSTMAGEEAIRTILSGPAGGVVGAYEVAKRAGFESAIAFDMGGTSTDVSLLHGGVGFTAETEVAGCPIRVPLIDIHTVGAGGGSIARVDPGGALAVGPESAGADPGPICYGKGDQVTVTDANLFLGRLDPEQFLGGRMALDMEPVKAGVARLAKTLRLDDRQAAEGVVRVANQHMAGAIRLISVERGHDPRRFALISFGGAGAMHACSLAEILGIPGVVVPGDPGILSARGMLTADVVKDYARTVLLPLAGLNKKTLASHFSPLLQKGREDLKFEGFAKPAFSLFIDMRYLGQSYELTLPYQPETGVDLRESLRAAFDALHDERFGTASPESAVEVVTLRVRGTGEVERPPARRLPKARKSLSRALMGSRKMIFDGREVEGSVYMRDEFSRGNRFKGPALVCEFSATTVVPPGWECRVDEWGNLVLKNLG